jgi:endonuclease/exonuclease/phosphatase family metal-dependent hydrolase
VHITIAVQNLQHGGFADESGRETDRRPLIFQRLKDADADIVILNEARRWTTGDHGPLGLAMSELGMYPAPAPRVANDLGSIILIRWKTMGPFRFANHDLSEQTVHGFSNVSFAIDGVAQPLTVAATHINPYSPTAAIAEADLVVTRAFRKGCLAVIGGDFNFPPSRGPEPDYTVMRPYNLASRTLPDTDGTGLPPNRQLAQAIERRGFVDAALHLHDQTGNEELLARTASDDRIDRFYVSEPLADALVRYELLDTPQGASDHHGVLIELDTDRIRHDLMWDYK